MKKTRKNRKGYTLVELVIVILVIAVLAAATFLGGAAVIRNSQDSRTRSDLHAFEVAAQSLLYQHTELGTKTTTPTAANDCRKIAALMNERLSADLQFVVPTTVDANNANPLLSAKKDPWDQKYNISVMPAADTGFTSYAIVVWSNGNDAVKDADIAPANWKDDKGVVIMYSDGNVSAQYFGFDGSTATAGVTNTDVKIGQAKTGVYDAAKAVIANTQSIKTTA